MLGVGGLWAADLSRSSLHSLPPPPLSASTHPYFLPAPLHSRALHHRDVEPNWSGSSEWKNWQHRGSTRWRADPYHCLPQFIGVYQCLQNRAWWTAACVRLTFPVVSACGQPIGVSWSCQDTVAASSDADRSPLQLRWSGTRLWTLFRTQVHPTLSIDNFRSTLKTHLHVAQRDT